MAQYNGWTNYETWQVNLEGGFDGLNVSDILSQTDALTIPSLVKEVATYLSDMAHEMIDAECPEPRCGYSFTRSLAQSHLRAVKWREIAEHLIGANYEHIPRRLQDELVNAMGV